MPSHRAVAAPAPVSTRPASRLSQVLGAVLFALAIALLVEVFFESWVQNLFGTKTKVPDGNPIISLPEWPKTVKSGLYLAILALVVAKVAVDRAWRRFTTAADLALVALGLFMVVAGLVGGSSASLIGQALFVYFRGALLFYAWRALNLPWSRVRPVLWVLGGILALQSLAAIVQMVAGPDGTAAMGWLNLTWADIYRAQGLLDHPNHLGHALVLAMLGLLAWFVTRPKVSRRWWLLFGFFALALSATQSRESAGGFLVAAVLIGFLRRGRWRAVSAAIAVVLVLSVVQLGFRPGNRAELQRRLAGVLSALHIPSGAEGAETYCVEGVKSDHDCTTTVPQREIRILYAQQGIRLFAHSPLIGYGVGQFGGIVADSSDPDWQHDPRFTTVLGAGGFNMYDSPQQQVDTFWLHLFVEVGIAGVLLYLIWLYLLVRPILKTLPGWRLRAPPAPSAAGVHPVGYWAPAAVLFGVLIAFLSPALEDPLFPPLLFTVLGFAWALLARGELTSRTDAAGTGEQRTSAEYAPARSS